MAKRIRLEDANSIRVESDEGGFLLIINPSDDYPMYYRVHDPTQLLAAVDEHIRPWHAEGEATLAEFKRVRAGLEPFLSNPPPFKCDPDESGGYDPNDPKSDGYHDRMSAIYDNRAGK